MSSGGTVSYLGAWISTPFLIFTARIVFVLSTIIKLCACTRFSG